MCEKADPRLSTKEGVSPHTLARVLHACVESVIIYGTVTRPMIDRQVRPTGYSTNRIRQYVARMNKKQLATSGRPMQELGTEVEVQGMRQIAEERALRYVGHVWRLPKECGHGER